jgi:hypothetical protein
MGRCSSGEGQTGAREMKYWVVWRSGIAYQMCDATSFRFYNVNIMTNENNSLFVAVPQNFMCRVTMAWLNMRVEDYCNVNVVMRIKQAFVKEMWYPKLIISLLE